MSLPYYRSSGIRTHGLTHPKGARYQAAPYPDERYDSIFEATMFIIALGPLFVKIRQEEKASD
jgi:hypothetical protein